MKMSCKRNHDNFFTLRDSHLTLRTYLWLKLIYMIILVFLFYLFAKVGEIVIGHNVAIATRRIA